MANNQTVSLVCIVSLGNPTIAGEVLKFHRGCENQAQITFQHMMIKTVVHETTLF